MWYDDAIDAALAGVDAARRRRRMRAVAIPGALLTLADGRRLIDASSNDYLGLSQHPALKARAIEWVQRFGAGARGARLVTGTLEAVLELEARLAAFKGKEAALIFNAGYQANAAVLPALFELAGGREALVFTDRLNHASLHAGCAAAAVKEIRFRHNDLAHLDELLARQAGGRPCFIVTESVFSMDGDRADVAALADLADRHNALLYLDEAHATGVLGPRGCGLGSAAQNAVVMGTLGKSFGSAGAYIAASKPLIDYLVNRCAGFIYSTAPAPAACGAVDAALDLIPAMDAERTLLAERGERLRQRLAEFGIATLASTTQIVPAVLGSEAQALAAQQRLEERGVLAVAIRPPTVPEGASRLRFSLSSAHSAADFDTLLAAVATLA
ncbi:MAG: 8-amino-7-oxononanoate synthase [Rhodocyclaceae bacterium]|nr:8-amino-7-oxononanoate synthase [Rhodocyclaceae bacterium]